MRNPGAPWYKILTIHLLRHESRCRKLQKWLANCKKRYRLKKEVKKRYKEASAHCLPPFRPTEQSLDSIEVFSLDCGRIVAEVIPPLLPRAKNGGVFLSPLFLYRKRLFENLKRPPPFPMAAIRSRSGELLALWLILRANPLNPLSLKEWQSRSRVKEDGGEFSFS